MTRQDGAAPIGSSIDSQLGWSTLSSRAWPLSGALAEIGGQGFGGIDLGALPGVGDHVPPPLPCDLVDVLADQILASGSAVRLINADLAGTNEPGRVAAEIPRRLRTLVDPARRLARRPSWWPVVARAPNCAPDRPTPSRRWLAPSPPPPSSPAAPASTSSMSTSPTMCRAKSTSATGRSTSPAITVELETRYITNGPRPPLAPPN